jgi:ribosomal protein S18 acetylase RimI-like enzyme
MLMTARHDQPSAVAGELLRHAENYLRAGGAKVIYGGGIAPLNPFYLGLYGGSESPGVLASDGALWEPLLANGFREIDRVVILQRELATYRPPIDRRLTQVRRQYSIEATFDPRAVNWWEACQFSQSDRTRFVLRSPHDPVAACTATFWDMEPLASSWGVHAVGLTDLATHGSLRRQGLATLLVSEALRQLQAHGIARCQVQCMAANTAALGLYKKLGFGEIDRGVVLRKES